MNATRNIRRTLIIAVIGAAAALGIAGCTTDFSAGQAGGNPAAASSAVPAVTVHTQPPATPTPASTPQPTPGAVGAAQQIIDTTSGTKTTSVVTVMSAAWSTTGTSNYSNPQHGAFLVVHVKIAGVTGQSSYNPFDWTVKAADGGVWLYSFQGAPEPVLHYGTVAPGAIVSGYLAFDLPQGPVTLTLGQNPGVGWIIP